MYKKNILACIILYTATSHFNLAKTSPYKENLAIHRMQFCSPSLDATPPPTPKLSIKKTNVVTTTYDVTQQLHDLWIDLKAYYAMNDAIPGYTIQIYAGSREQAFKLRNLLYTNFPSLTPEIQYKRPHFTVRIGVFLDRLEAYKWYFPIKNLIAQAIISPTYFPNEPHIFKINNNIIANEGASQRLEEQQAYQNETK
jgi:hypothetical protein